MATTGPPPTTGPLAGDVPDRPLDPRRLLVFREVARRGSLAAAAGELGWTQPAVAQHVRRLEADCGVALVRRSTRGVTLTNAGTVLAAHAEAVARQLHAAREDLASLASLRTGQVHIAAFPSAAATFVPAALRDLADRAPHVTVRLTEAEPPEARALLATGDIDLAVVFSYDDVPEPPDDTVLRQPLFDDPLLLVLPADHPLAADADVELADLASGQWISGCARCRAHLLAAGGRRGFLPDIRHTTDDYVVTQALVAAGLGVALLPALALTAARDDRLTFLPVRDHAPRRIHLVQPRGPLSPAQRALSEVLRTVASNPRPSAPR